MKLIANNKKAYFDYFVEETVEAGIVLQGSEVKSCRAGKASIKEAYIDIKSEEMFVRGLNISPYEYGGIYNPDPVRIRKLLLKKSEIIRFFKLRSKDGYTIMPLKLYFNSKGLVKLEIGLCKGKKKYDKRAEIAKKETQRYLREKIRY